MKKKSRKLAKAFTLDDESIAGLKKLEDITGKGRSEIIRSLIPSELLVDAAVGIMRQVNEKADLEYVSRLFLEGFTSYLVEAMKARDELLDWQVASAYRQPKSNEAIAELFVKYNKALKKVKGYQIQSVMFVLGNTEKEQHIVLGPEDNLDRLVIILICTCNSGKNS